MEASCAWTAPIAVRNSVEAVGASTGFPTTSAGAGGGGGGQQKRARRDLRRQRGMARVPTPVPSYWCLLCLCSCFGAG